MNILQQLPTGIQIALILATTISFLLFLRAISTKHYFYFFRNILLAFFASLLLFPLSGWLVGTIYGFITYPAYDAVIHEVIEETRTNDSGGEYQMYSAKYKFLDENNNEIIIKSSLSTSGELFVGDNVTVKYKDGEVIEYTMAGILLPLGGLMALGFLPIILMYLLFESIGLKKGQIKIFNLELHYIFRVFIPFALLIMLGASINKVWLGISGAERIGIGGYIAVTIFTLMVLLTLYVILKSADKILNNFTSKN